MVKKQMMPKPVQLVWMYLAGVTVGALSKSHLP